MSKHFPGPWSACHDGNCQCGLIWAVGADTTVAQVHKRNEEEDVDYDPETVAANARLVASAPTLAARLDEAIRLLHLWPCDDAGYPLHPDVRAFLAAIDAESAGGTR